MSDKTNEFMYDKEHPLPKKMRPPRSLLNEKGQEIPDPIPMAPPIGYVQEPDLFERMRQMIRGEHLRLAAMEAGAETFAEADDFDIDDEVDPSSPWEEQFDPVDEATRFRLRDEAFRSEVERRVQEVLDAKAGNLERGSGNTDKRSGQSDPVRQGNTVKKSESASQDGVGEVATDAGKSKG